MISRQVFATVPVTVEYDLTPRGRTLTATVSALAHWAERNMDAVLAAQAAYAAAAQQAGQAQKGRLIHLARESAGPAKRGKSLA